MKLSTLMVTNSIIAFLFGIAFVLIPWQVFSLYGAGEPNPALNYAGQLFGVSLVTIAALTWSARNAGDSDARKAIVLALLIPFILMVFVGYFTLLKPVDKSKESTNRNLKKVLHNFIPLIVAPIIDFLGRIF